MLFMFMSTHNMILAATLAAQQHVEIERAKVEAELRSRIADLEDRLAAREQDLLQREAKIEKMELIMMPLSTAAGASYVRSLRIANGETPKPPSAMSPSAIKTSWQLTLEEHMKKIEEQEKAEKAAKAAKGN